MANGVTHTTIGLVTGLAIFLREKKDVSSHIESVLTATTATLFAKLPDILEPSLKNPNHRQFCHSFAVLAGIGYGFKKAYEWQPKSNIEKLLRLVALSATAGYASHLLLDATTPKSLPLIGKIS